MPLTDHRAALEAYCKRWKSLEPIEEWHKELPPANRRRFGVVGGTFGILLDNSAEFITLGSFSRGIPRKEWDVPLGDIEAFHFTVCPRANALVVLEVAALM